MPELTTTGLLCYDRTLPAWLALRLDPAVSLSDSDLATLAGSITLGGGTPADSESSADEEAARQAVIHAVQTSYPGAVVDAIRPVGVTSTGGQQFWVDFSVGTTGYQDTLWTAEETSSLSGGWQAAETPAVVFPVE